MKSILRSLLLTLCAGAQFAVAASLEAPEKLGMRPVGQQVYVDPEMPRDQAEKLLPLVAKARERVASFYGKLHANPKIVFCASADCYREFGAVGLGFSDGTNLVISPQGQRVAIIAHELAHVEFTARVGGFAKVLENIPQWFDEGQAVMVSMAEEFSEEAWKTATDNGKRAPGLHALAAMDDWVRLTGANGENMQFTYGTAKKEVSRWFERSGRDGLQALLEALRAEEPFAEAYARIEAGANQAVGELSGDHLSAAHFRPEPTAPASLVKAAW